MKIYIFCVGKMLECHGGGVDPTRSLKRNERTDYLTRSSEKFKRRYLTRSSTKNRTICSADETTGLSISGNLYRDHNQGVWNEISEEVANEMSKCVVSLALMDGGTVLFACSGIAVQCDKRATRFLTSASLVKALHVKRKDHDNLKVQVRHFENVTTGFLGDYDLDQNIATVNVMNFPSPKPVVWCNRVCTPHCKVASLGMDPSGKLMGTDGILKDAPSRSEWRGNLTVSTFSEVCDGGPLFSFDGRFGGMNLFLSTERTFFLQTFEPLLWLCSSTPLYKFKRPPRLNSNREREAYRDVRVLESLGYPALPESVSNDDMILVNNFEDAFGDEYGKGIWKKLSETGSSNICENIVALASFNGDRRLFACTGFFIKWNGCTTILTSASLIRDPDDDAKILENLRIEVKRPNKQQAEGTLQHYNLHYNVALVFVEDFCSREPAIIHDRWYDNCKLLAVGCCFKSGMLMASTGYQFVGPLIFDCEYLEYTKCRITKAGIGGPLVQLDGTFVGMNFYDEMDGTPYLSSSVILAVLDSFKTRNVSEDGHDGKKSHVRDWIMDGDNSVWPNSWPVPEPFWCHRNDLRKHKAEIWRSRPHLIDL
ncbi:unnamed protein product [Urochloa decumbens]|uniref:Uncharacterized protein n=1 Tax=Urochloa decumbens TaxID=240449 RepID=A0ABC8Z9F1_9POAL